MTIAGNSDDGSPNHITGMLGRCVRWSGRVAAALLFLLLVVVLSLWVVSLRVTWSTEASLALLDRLAGQLPIAVRYQQLGVSPLRGRIELVGLEVAPLGESRKPFFEARRLALRWDWFSLLSGRYRLIEVMGDGCTVTVIHLGQNRYNVTEWLRTPATKGAPPTDKPGLQLDRLVLRDTRVRYEDKPRRVKLGADQTSMDASLGADGRSGEVKLGWHALRVSEAGRQQTFGPSRLRARLNRSFLQIPECTLVSANSSLNVSGAVMDCFGKPQARLSGFFDGRIDDFRSWLPKPVSGGVRADFDLDGALAAPRWRATVTIQAAHFEGQSLQAGQFWLHGDRKQLVLDRSVLKTSFGSASAALRVTLAKRPWGEGSLTLENLDARKLARQLKLGPAYEQDFRVNGTMRFAVREGDWPKVQAKGDLRLKGVWRRGARAWPLVADGSWRWANDALTLASATLKGCGGTVRGQGVWYSKRLKQSYEAQIQVSGVRYEALAPLIDQASLLHGALDASVRVRGDRLSDLPRQADGHLRFQGALPPGVAANVKPLPLVATSKLRLMGPHLRCENVQVTIAKGRLSGSVTVPVTGALYQPALQGQFTVAGCQLQELNRAMELVEGPLDGTVQAALKLSGDRLIIQAYQVNTLGGMVQGQGVVDELDAAMPYTIDCRATGLRVAKLTQAVAVSSRGWQGQVAGQWRVRGKGAAYHFQGPTQVLALAPAAWNGAIPGPLRLIGTLDCTPKRYQTEGFRLAWAGVSGTIKGRYVPRQSVSMTLQAIREANGPVWGKSKTRLLDGLVRGTVRVEGPLTQCRYDVRVRGEALRLALGARDVRIGSLAFDTTGELTELVRSRATLQCQANRIGELAIPLIRVPMRYEASRPDPANGMMQASGTVSLPVGRYDFGGRYDLKRDRVTFEGQSNNLVWSDLRAALSGTGTILPDTTPLGASIKLAGHVKALEGQVNLHCGAFAWGERQLGATSLQATLTPGQILLKGQVFGDQLHLDGQAALAAPMASRMRIRFARQELLPLIDMLPQTVTDKGVVPVNGEVGGACVVEGPLYNPRALRLAMELQTLRLQYPEGVLQSVGPLVVNATADGVDCRRVHLEGLGHKLVAEGLLSVREASNWRARGVVNFETLEKLMPSVWTDARGSCEFDVTIAGVVGGPDATGTLALRRGNLRAQVLPQALNDLNARLRLSQDELFVERLGFQFGESGQVSTFGRVKLGLGYLPTRVSLRLNARDVTWLDDGVDLTGNADLSLAGPTEDLTLSGQLRVLEARVTRSAAWETWLPQGGAARDARASSATRWWQAIALRLQCVIPDTCRIDNELLKANLRGDLTVLGTIRKPALLGRLEAKDGQLMFQDHLYQLSEAAVDFIDANRIKPLIRVVATTRIQPHQITMRLDGTPDALRLDMSSTPPLPQADILLMMATGQGSAQLEQSRDVGLATASNLAMGVISRSMERGVKQTGMVDVLRIQPGLGQNGDMRGGQFTIGKRINEQLTVTYTQGVSLTGGTTTGSIVVFDYALGDRFVLKLEQSLAGGFNGSARYRFGFR